MANLSKSIEIGGREFKVTPLFGMKAVTTLPRLMRLLGPALSSLLEQAGKAKSVADIDVSAAVGSLQLLTAKLTEDEVRDLFKTFLESTFIDGSELWGKDGKSFNVHFQGRPMDAYKLLWFAISEVNYGDFFGVFTGKHAATAASDAPSEASNI